MKRAYATLLLGLCGCGAATTAEPVAQPAVRPGVEAVAYLPAKNGGQPPFRLYAETDERIRLPDGTVGRGGVMLPNGSRVLVVEAEGEQVRVRVLEGEYRDRFVWLYRSALVQASP